MARYGPISGVSYRLACLMTLFTATYGRGADTYTKSYGGQMGFQGVPFALDTTADPITEILLTTGGNYDRARGYSYMQSVAFKTRSRKVLATDSMQPEDEEFRCFRYNDFDWNFRIRPPSPDHVLLVSGWQGVIWVCTTPTLLD